KDEIDNMLVFSALFSAVVTSFVIDSYQDLKPKPPSESTLILRQISAQLVSFTLDTGHLNSTKPAFDYLAITAESDGVPFTIVLVNALWFFALVCSLAAASIGISIRPGPARLTAQSRAWHITNDDEPVGISHLVNIRIWHVRHEAYEDWHVTGLLDLLPVLLQASLVLFLAGLIILLRNLYPVIGNVVMAQVAVLCIILLWTTIAPSLRQKCPYKSPQALWVIQIICALRIPIHLILTPF
ncbi:hypothetical protein WOLCODRAFT_52944, partial [Wolfiporia cocos MD-104 SS10]